MKVVVLSYSGNVGKSTISHALLSPRIPAPVYAVETINSDGTDLAGVKGKEFAALHEELLAETAAVVDVGASNVESALITMRKYPGWADDYEFFVVPTTPAKKQQRDTVSTIEELASLGVPPEKIRLVMNMVELDDEPEVVFSSLFDYARKHRRFKLRPDAVIRLNEAFTRAKSSGANLSVLASDPTDWKAKIAAATTQEEKLEAAAALSMKRLASGVTMELDRVFATLFATA